MNEPIRPRPPITLEAALAQRDEARLRVNLMCLATGHAEVYPIEERNRALWNALRDAHAPIFEPYLDEVR